MSDAALFLPLPDDDILYTTLLTRDPAYDGFAFIGVKSAGVFHRLTCPTRKSRRENTLLFDSIKGCVEAGFRPCLRCWPLERLGTQGPLVSDLLQRLGRQSQRHWFEDDLTASDYDPPTMRRVFKRGLGVTFLEMICLRRLGQIVERLFSDTRVIDAQLDAGSDSNSGFRSAFARLLGGPPSQSRGRGLLRADWLRTLLDAILTAADAQALHLLELFNHPTLNRELKRLQRSSGLSVGFGCFALIDRIETELADYFDGTPVRLQTLLTLNASALTRAVWQALREVPCGDTQSYAGLAKSIGLPSPVRAVARTNRANWIAIVIPYHRVIGSDGSLTGYGGDLWRKRQLLEHERRMGTAG